MGEIAKLVSEYPMQTVLSIMFLAMILAIGRLAYKYADRFLNLRLPEEKDKEEHPQHVEMLLTHHPVFVRLKALRLAIATEFVLPNKGKEAVFKEILLFKIQIFLDNLYELAQNAEECFSTCPTTTCNKLYNMNMNMLEKSIEEYNSFFYNSNYTADEQKCLALVMQKFNNWHSNRVVNMKDSIQLVCDSKFYADCRTKQSVIFDLYIGAFAETINDAEKTLNAINGDLKGLVFKNIQI